MDVCLGVKFSYYSQFSDGAIDTNRNSKMEKIFSFVAALSLSSLLFSVTLV
jgi:hypothetical protein